MFFLAFFFQKKQGKIRVWLATGTFATENRGDLRLRFLVLSGQPAPGGASAIGMPSMSDHGQWLRAAPALQSLGVVSPYLEGLSQFWLPIKSWVFVWHELIRAD